MNNKTRVTATAKLEAELKGVRRHPLIQELEEALQRRDTEDDGFWVGANNDFWSALEKIVLRLNELERPLKHGKKFQMEPPHPPELKTILKNAFRMVAPLYREWMLWVFVRDVCGVGSTTARDICHACGWHPDQIGTMIENKK